METKYNEGNLDTKCAFSDAYLTLHARFFTETSNYMNKIRNQSSKIAKAAIFVNLLKFHSRPKHHRAQRSHI